VTSETGRVEAFSDGVFAIAITLLVLDVKVPSGGAGTLASALRSEWPFYAAFLLSFAFIGIMWINHHRLFTQIRRSTNMLMVLNLLLLLGVTVVPFTTAVLAAYLSTGEAKTAALLYNGTYVVIAIFFSLLWRYAVSAQLLHENAEHAAHISAQYAVGPVMYLVCVALVWVSVAASLILNSALALFFALPPHVAAKVRRHKAGSGQHM
jgi:uncharacterized membrane protein